MPSSYLSILAIGRVKSTVEWKYGRRMAALSDTFHQDALYVDHSLDVSARQDLLAVFEPLRPVVYHSATLRNYRLVGIQDRFVAARISP